MPQSPTSKSREIPYGTVTLLFTDIEGSTKLWQELPDFMPAALARHHAILNHTIAENNGYVFQIVGDGFHSAFESAFDAIQAALDAQRALYSEPWGGVGEIRVRMALHTDRAEVHPSKYNAGEYLSGEYLFLARTARLLSAGHGGQILVSEATAQLVQDQPQNQFDLRDMGTHRVKDFQPERIFQVTTVELRSDFPPLNTLDSLPNNLPRQLNSFVGRANEIKQLTERLEHAQLLTLVGPGGAGKTRLSLQMAAGQIDRFKHGVWFVELAALSNPELVPQAVMTTLRLHEQHGRSITDVLKDYLRDKSLLILLDNCEQVIAACAELAEALLRSAPRLKILATSREPLAIAGEETFPVPSLTFPEAAQGHGEMRGPLDAKTLAEFDSVRLFVDRARAVQPTFAVTDANAAAVAEICRRLDGIPLALELAAARVKGLTVEQIAGRLDDRFRLLTGGSRTAMPRHQTLQATIEWSYVLLSEQECILMQRLSVFAGGWTLEAAEKICAGDGVEQVEVMDLNLRLVDKSLVVVEQDGDAARYRFLDTIRQFAQDKLATGKQTARRIRNLHLNYFLDFVVGVDRTVRGTEQESGLGALDRELDNLRAALAWAAECGNAEAELRLASELSRYWRVRSFFSEGRGWLEDALARSESAPPILRARAMMRAGSLASYQADYAHAKVLLEESLALHRELNDSRGTALCLNLLSHGMMMTGDLDGAQRALEESLAIFASLDDSRGMGYALFFLGSTLHAGGETETARPLLEESLQRLNAVGDKWWVGNAMIQLGAVLNRQGESEKALECFREALEISAQFGDTRGTARGLLYVAEAKCTLGEYEQARTKYVEALRLIQEIGDKWWATVCMEGLALIAVRQNDARRAARLLGAAEHVHQQLGAPIMQVYRESRDWTAAEARAQLGADAFVKEQQAGRALTYDEAVEFAMSEQEQAAFQGV